MSRGGHYGFERRRRADIQKAKQEAKRARKTERAESGAVGPEVGEAQDAGAPKSEPKPGATMVYKAVAPEEEPVPATNGEAEVVRETAVLSVEGRRYELTKRRVVIGRSKDCDIQLADPNVSRRHAEVRQEGAAYWAVDLDSTNGMEVNGRRQKRAKLRQGDRITLGSTQLLFRRETESD